jgi:hypothetical protein
MKLMSMEEIDKQVADNKALANKLAAVNEAVILRHDDGRTALAGPDMSKPGQYRITWLDADGDPSGHTNAVNLYGAIYLGLSEGYRFTQV